MDPDSPQPDSTSPALRCTPIGYVRSNMKVKFDAPPQPDRANGDTSTIELLPGLGFDMALSDLSGFDHIWLVWWFHRNSGWKPLVLPPRGPEKRRGVFATRSPHRPNPIGLTAVPLLGISGLTLTIGSSDLIDGTPILDIKPYLASADSFPDARLGWLEEVQREAQLPPRFAVQLGVIASSQLEWLRERFQLDFFSRARELLERDPAPHRTRRIVRLRDGSFRMGSGAWRVHFITQDCKVTVTHISPGFPQRLLESEGYTEIPHRDAQIAFLTEWPEAPEVSPA